jgi:hypothetical protein
MHLYLAPDGSNLAFQASKEGFFLASAGVMMGPRPTKQISATVKILFSFIGSSFVKVY